MLRKIDYKYFNKARKAAEISDYPSVHVGCVAIYKGEVIGIGWNCNKTHPLQKYYNRYRVNTDDMSPKLHAELYCINQFKSLNINFSKVKLYIYRICKNRPFGLARPCPSCMAAIRDLGIKDIYYTSDDGYVYEKIEKNYIGDVA